MSKHICLFGDSITHGYNDFNRGGWGNRLNHFFNNSDYDVSVYNCGISGDDTKGLLKRFKIESESRDANMIIFAIGTNDSFYFGSKDKVNVKIDKFGKNLQELIKQAKELTNEIVFLGLPPIDQSKTQPLAWASNIYHDEENTKIYNEKVKEVAKKNDLPFIDLYNYLNVDDIEDGVHPSPNGHKKIFVKVKEFLIKNKFV